MNINIKILNVGDADAILLSLEKEEEIFVILIDGGRPHHADKVKAEMDGMLSQYRKSGPDLVICTHYDEDHIGGLLSVLDAYEEIGTLWSFDIKQLLILTGSDAYESESIFPSEQNDYVGASFGSEQEKVVFDSLVQSVLQEKQLIEKAIKKKLVPVEPIAGKVHVSGWAEIEVLGPTQQYYDHLFPKDLSIEDIREESRIMAEEESGETQNENPCSSLRLKTSPISKVNLNSAIILITVDQKKYLFAADAGINSFYAIPNYQERLQGIHWLKVPHHGSKNNINNDLIQLMRPSVAVISGDGYISDNLMKCLEKHGTQVYNTRDHGDVWFANGNLQVENE